MLANIPCQNVGEPDVGVFILPDVALPLRKLCLNTLVSAGLPWLLPRLRDVKGLHLDACHDTFQTFTSKRSLRQSVSLLLGATSRLSQLQTLVSIFKGYNLPS